MSGTGDAVELRGLRARGRHGVLPAERELGQEFAADVVLHLHERRGVRAAAASDDLADAVDYSRVAADVHAVLAGEPVDLLETLASRVAEACLRHDGVARVEVAVHKPQAPVGVPFDDVVVRTARTAATERPAGPAAAAGGALGTALGAALDAVPAEPVPVVLALGANAGDPAAALRSAVAALAAQPGVTGVRASSVLETDPVGGPVQPRYLNAVVRASTTLSARAVLAACRRVEAAHGRDRSREQRWGPRTLDVDLVAHGDLAAADEELAVPHPRAAQRAFVLVPWAELAPDDVLPGAGRVGDLAAAASASPGQRAALRPRPDVVLAWPGAAGPVEGAR
ncbi:2-amino-4-hydroxy-6-hydroxymethyldihydropteridine diphosphokinase [Quadrisphaera sp. DSM 44207]|uniref:2-amino-4-hydroxy-6- hydroxymethyldihydropteridine diphosphokinase n=1 Tax=Quadrisphaera sp. DSM 44207 TaxID=1881057 RepID=UPI000B823249|nr:2-amino-4-hydroxy-6-hydroxymethyldihydropteridine diphosphokinase [Quadrisphaera sp. DSM 44207]